MANYEGHSDILQVSKVHIQELHGKSRLMVYFQIGKQYRSNVFCLCCFCVVSVTLLTKAIAFMFLITYIQIDCATSLQFDASLTARNVFIYRYRIKWPGHLFTLR